MKQYAILGIAILVAGLFTIGFGIQDIYAPQPKPEKIQAGPIKTNGDLSGFEVSTNVILPETIPQMTYTVETTMDLFKPDGTPIRAGLEGGTETVSRNEPIEGGENSRVHKILVSVVYEVPEEMMGVEITVKVISELFDENRNKVASSVKWGDVTLKRG